MGLGFGGNLPIDGALFLECVPPSRQAMLTLMSLFWPIGGVVTALVGWGFLGFLPDSACASAENCTYEMNRGWRYCVFALGGLTLAMCLGRYLFPLQESPKYYIARGKYHEAVKVLKWLARNNNVELHVEAKDFESTPEMQELIEKRKQSAVERFKPLFGKELFLTVYSLFNLDNTNLVYLDVCKHWL
jgi:MFS family permease